MEALRSSTRSGKEGAKESADLRRLRILLCKQPSKQDPATPLAGKPASAGKSTLQQGHAAAPLAAGQGTDARQATAALKTVDEAPRGELPDQIAAVKTSTPPLYGRPRSAAKAAPVALPNTLSQRAAAAFWPLRASAHTSQSGGAHQMPRHLGATPFAGAPASPRTPVAAVAKALYGGLLGQRMTPLAAAMHTEFNQREPLTAVPLCVVVHVTATVAKWSARARSALLASKRTPNWLDLNGCGSLAALIKLEACFGVRAFQLLGYQLPADPPADDASDAPGLRRVLGGWCRTSDKFADVGSACKAFDGRADTHWFSRDGQFLSGRTDAHVWLECCLPAQQGTVALARYTLTAAAGSPSRDPMDFVLYGAPAGQGVKQPAPWLALDKRSGVMFEERGQALAFDVAMRTPCRAFRLDIQHVRGDHADGVHLAGLALHAHSLLSASGGACCAWQPAKAQP